MTTIRGSQWVLGGFVVALVAAWAPAVRAQANEGEHRRWGTLTIAPDVGVLGRYAVTDREDLPRETGRAAPAPGGTVRLHFRLPLHLELGPEVRVTSVRLAGGRATAFDTGVSFGGGWPLRSGDGVSVRFLARVTLGMSGVLSSLQNDPGLGFAVGAWTGMEFGFSNRLGLAVEVGGNYRRVNLGTGWFEDRFTLTTGMLSIAAGLVVYL